MIEVLETIGSCIFWFMVSSVIMYIWHNLRTERAKEANVYRVHFHDETDVKELLIVLKAVSSVRYADNQAYYTLEAIRRDE